MIQLLVALILAIAPFATPSVAALPQSDRAAVEQAGADYLEALYLADPTRVERSVHPQLTKRGFWRESAAAPYGPQLTMTYEQLRTLATTWNAKKNQDTTIKKVDVYDVLDQTASAKVTASWGIDYLQLWRRTTDGGRSSTSSGRRTRRSERAAPARR